MRTEGKGLLAESKKSTFVTGSFFLFQLQIFANIRQNSVTTKYFAWVHADMHVLPGCMSV
jgi:hypothetical protein